MYTIFNPWKGFPSANAIYLDNDFQRMRANGQLAFGTAQEAYDAAVATGVATVIMVGKIDSTQSLDVTLTANYNSLVSWVGINPKFSQIRNLIGTNAAGNGRTITIDLTNVLFNSISSAYIGGGIGAGGAITITSFGESNINTINSSSSGIPGATGGLITIIGSIESATLISADSLSGIAGNIIIDDLCKIQDVSSIGAENGGNITIGKRCTILGNIDSSGTLRGGNVIIGEGSSVAGYINLFGQTVTGGNLTLKSCFIHGATMDIAAVTVGRIFSNNSVIEGNIDKISGNSVLSDTLMISTTSSCIQEVFSDGAQFHNCIFIAKDGSNCITSTLPMAITANNTLSKTDFDVDITVTGNNNLVNSALKSPLP